MSGPAPAPRLAAVAASLDDTAFRATLGRFASGVTVLTTAHDGVDHAITASAFTSVSLDPPLVLVCVDHHNRLHDPVLAAGVWGISVLAESARDVATWLATRGRDISHQLDRVPHHRGAVTDVALVDGALAWLECRTWAAYDGSDHTILVGEVVGAAVGAEHEGPLMYYRSHYGALVPWPVSEKGTDPAAPGTESAAGVSTGRQ